MKFGDLGAGAEFRFLGRRLRKVSMSMAVDERGYAAAFMRDTAVESEGPLATPEERAEWEKPGPKRLFVAKPRGRRRAWGTYDEGIREWHKDSGK